MWRSVYAISVPYGVEIWHDHPNTLTQRSLAFSHAFGEARRTEERGLPDIARVAKKNQDSGIDQSGPGPIDYINGGTRTSFGDSPNALILVPAMPIT